MTQKFDKIIDAIGAIDAQSDEEIINFNQAYDAIDYVKRAMINITRNYDKIIESCDVNTVNNANNMLSNINTRLQNIGGITKRARLGETNEIIEQKKEFPEITPPTAEQQLTPEYTEKNVLPNILHGKTSPPSSSSSAPPKSGFNLMNFLKDKPYIPAILLGLLGAGVGGGVTKSPLGALIGALLGGGGGYALPQLIDGKNILDIFGLREPPKPTDTGADTKADTGAKNTNQSETEQNLNTGASNASGVGEKEKNMNVKKPEQA
ncbi:MAG: hypothetical protein ABIH48_02940 [Candidatus Falkowbacteria bacterium]